MNKHGQTLIFFVLMLPILLFLLAFTVDVGLILKEKTRSTSTIRTVLRVGKKDLTTKKIKEVIIENNIPVENLEIKMEENRISIKNEYKIKSIFGSLIGLKEYKIKIEMDAILKNGEIKIEKE